VQCSRSTSLPFQKATPPGSKWVVQAARCHKLSSEISVNGYLAGPVPDWVSRPRARGHRLRAFTSVEQRVPGNPDLTSGPSCGG
jgi:hypothetical protein